jgi:drug/metabolite transporter (DMT)-like permease
VTAIDGLLLLMVLIWGSNYTIIKSAFSEIDPQAFNALRMIEASTLLVGAMALARRRRWNPARIFYTPDPLTRRDAAALAALGAVGHCLYQYCFVGGVARTSVANAALILAASPMVITLVSAAVGADRISRRHWAGVALSFAGIYLALGRGARLAGESVTGDLLMGAAVLCWACYTVGARPLMQRHSPVAVTALSMLCGTALYLPICLPALMRVDWERVSGVTWASLVYSGAAAIAIAYVIWYAAVRELGSSRTAIYSNLLPVVAMLTAWIWLGESLGPAKLFGVAAVLAGVALTRSGSKLGRP